MTDMRTPAKPADEPSAVLGDAAIAAVAPNLWRLTLAPLDRDRAHRFAGVLTDLADPLPLAVSLSVDETTLAWRVEAYLSGDDVTEQGPEPFAISFVLSLAALAGGVLPTFELRAVEEENWVAHSQAALPPVAAGRFTIHGTHDRDRVALGPWTIEIDAGEAFGTAHHATTYGCLQALDRLGHEITPVRILDLGTGSGVLAIAAARIWPHATIIASDLDDDAVRVATQNVSKARVAGKVAVIKADGLGANGRYHDYDLVIANILAGPLQRMAGQVTGALAPRAVLVLSGILVPQAAAVIATYRAHGAAIVAHRRIEGWSTLVFQNRGTG